MISTDYLSRPWFLLNSAPHRKEDENAPLYSVEYILKYGSSRLENAMEAFTVECKVSKGLYNQRVDNDGGKEDYMSPDQLIAFIAFFIINDRNWKLANIWEYLKSHWFTYDNLTGQTNLKRLMQPSVVLFSAVAAGSKWLTPLLSLVCLVACMSKKGRTSGKLKAWVIMRSLGLTKTFSFCTKLLKEDDWDEVFEIYFPLGHPLRDDK